MGQDLDEIVAAIEQRIAAALTEIAALEVPRSVLVGVGVLADKHLAEGHPTSTRARLAERELVGEVRSPSQRRGAHSPSVTGEDQNAQRAAEPGRRA